MEIRSGVGAASTARLLTPGVTLMRPKATTPSIVVRACEQCGEQYVVRRSWQRFCSGRCTKRASMARLSDVWDQRRADPEWQAADRERQRVWREANPEKAKAKERRWKSANPGAAREKSQRWRERNPAALLARDRRERSMHPDRVSARKAVDHAVKTGALIRPGSCSACGRQCKPHGHHDDYTRKLDVQWLCAHCHKAAHPGG